MSRYRRRIMHRRPTHQADNSVSQKRRRVTLPRAACAAGKHPPREEARWERAEGQEVGVPASISCPGRRPYVPVSLVLGGAACTPQKSLPALQLLTPVIFFGPIVRALHGAVELTRHLLLAKLRAAPSRIDEPQFPRLPLELPRNPWRRRVAERYEGAPAPSPTHTPPTCLAKRPGGAAGPL